MNKPLSSFAESAHKRLLLENDIDYSQFAINDRYSDKDFSKSINYGGKRVDIFYTKPTMRKLSFERATLTSFDDVFTNNVHVAISASIVKHIAGMMVENKNGDFVGHRSSKACQDIVFSGYTQPIFEDVVMGIADALLNWYAKGSIFNVCRVDTGTNQLVFDTYINKNGIEKSYYNKLYGVVEQVLYENSKHATPLGQKLYGLDIVLDTHNGKDKILGLNNTRFSIASAYNGGIHDIIGRADFQSFIRYSMDCGKLSDTTLKSYFTVLWHIIDGKKLDDVAKASGLGIATVKRRKKDISEIYTDWLKCDDGGITIEHKSPIFYGCATMDNTGIAPISGHYFEDTAKGYTPVAELKFDKAIKKGGKVRFITHKEYTPLTTSYTPIVGAIIPDDKEKTIDQFASDSTVIIKDTGNAFCVYYRTDIVMDDGRIEHNDIFVHEIPKK